MLLRTLPDFTAQPGELPHWFGSRWGRENCVIWGRARRARFGPCVHSLSIRAVWNGEERCQFDGRTVAVDDDSFLILNSGRVCATQIDATRPVESLAVCFAPSLVERAHGAMVLSLEQALERGNVAVERSVEFLESLQAHDKVVSPVLRYIRLHVLRGIDDEAWYDEQLDFLLVRMLAHRDAQLARVDSLRTIRPTTRREIYRRIALATDYLHSNYREQRLGLDALARAACLSKYHFLRLFTLVHGLTPHQYLSRKRAKIALRLLQTTPLNVNQIAASVGLLKRHALLRQMRRWTGLSPRDIRKVEAAALTAP